MMPLAPIYLLGMAAAGVPFLLHLIYRRRAQKVFFSTIRFLRLSNERTAHRRRIQDLLLLLLRTLLFIVLSLALAQFVMKVAGAGALGARARVVFIVDNSYSMGVVHEGKMRYGVAKEAALAILRALQDDDAVAVLFTSGPERRLEPKFETRKEAHDIINRSTCSAEGGNLLGVLKEAQDLLLAEKTEPSIVYVLTDMQKLAWERAARGEERIETALAREERARILVVVYDAGGPAQRNLAVRAVRVSGQAFVQGAPVTVDADIYNPAPEPVSAVTSLVVSGEPKGNRTIELVPNSTGTVSFAYEPPKSGIACVQVRLQDDALAVDNERSFKLEVKDRIRALIVQDAASAVDFLDQSYFLERALDPSIALGGPSASIIRADRLLARDLTGARLKEYDVVFLLNVRTVPDATAAALGEFVRQGGGLIFFAGDEVDVKEYRRLFAGGAEPLLPLPLLELDRSKPDRERATAVTSIDESHFVFAPFRGLNVMKAVRVYKSARIDLHATTPMQALAHLADGQPLVLELARGRGRVVFVTVTADASWSNLPVTDAFLPMVHQLVYRVCGSFGETDTLAVGAPYRFRFPESAARVDVDVTRPDGIEERVSTKPTADTNEAVYAQTFRPGFYRFSTRGGVTKQGAFVVNPDTAESNLERISDDALERHLAPSNVRVFSSVNELLAFASSLREGVQLQGLFIAATIAVALFETVISNWVTPRGQDKKRSALEPEETAERAE